MEKFALLLGLLFTIAYFIGQKPNFAFGYALAGSSLTNPFKNLLHQATAFYLFKAEEVEKKLGEIKEDITGFITKTTKQVEENGKINEDTKNEVKNALVKLKEVSDKNEELQKAFDEQQTEAKKNRSFGPDGKKTTSQTFLDILQSNKETLKSFSTKRDVNIDLQVKAADMNTSATFLKGTYFIEPERVPGILQPSPYEIVHVRSYLPNGTTSSPLMSYVQDTGGTGKAEVVAEGAQKPQLDRAFEIKDAKAIKIAASFRVSEELLDDVQGMAAYLANIGLDEVKKEEDLQLLTGDGTGANMLGINTAAQTFVRLNGIGQVTAANEMDVLIATIALLRNRKVNPTLAMVSEGTFAGLRLKKKTDGSYLFPELGYGGQAIIDGVQLRTSPHMTVGEFTVGDFRTGAMVFDRMQANVRFYDQDRDNAIKNLVTIIMEERLMMPIYKPYAFINDTFTAGKTALAAA